MWVGGLINADEGVVKIAQKFLKNLSGPTERHGRAEGNFGALTARTSATGPCVHTFLPINENTGKDKIFIPKRL
jgi:hypothetical protein